MNTIIDSLSKNPWLIVMTFILTPGSIILAVLFYFRSRKIKRINTAIRSVNLFRETAEKIEGLKILYGQVQAPTITVTKIAFWNDGSETIYGTDVASASPIVIKTKHESIILEAKIIHSVNKCSLCELSSSENGKEVELRFDYIDKKEGCVIQLLHTGDSSSDIAISGTIKGIGSIATKKLKQPLFILLARSKISRRINKKTIGCITIALGLIFPILLYFADSLSKDSSFKLPFLYKLVGCIIVALMYIPLGLSMIKRRVPKGFEMFEESI